MKRFNINMLLFIIALTLSACNSDRAEDATDVESAPEYGKARQDNTDQEYEEQNSMRYKEDSVVEDRSNEKAAE